MISAVADRKGPVIWLTGCVHGDEVGGTAVIHEVFRFIQKNDLIRGSVYALPILNPLGFESTTRQIPLSHEDLNRSFPGNSKGSFAERVARRVFNTICETSPNLVIDLHNDWRQSIPYVLVDHPGCVSNQTVFETARTLAEKSGLLVVEDESGEVMSGMEHTLSFNLCMAGIPAITFELGESQIVNEIDVHTGLQAILRILNSFGMLTKGSFAEDEFQPASGKYSYSDQPLAQTSGLLRFAIQPGAIVKPGTVMARVYDAFGKVQETIRAESRGIVLGHTDSSLCYPGKSVVAYAIPDEARRPATEPEKNTAG